MTPPAAMIHAAAPLPVRRRAKLRTRAMSRGGAATASELWVLLSSPQDRARWNDALREYEEAGATGVLVPAGPRLLDILRNAGEDEDRSDLSLSQG